MKHWLQKIKILLDSPVALYASLLVAVCNKSFIAYAYTSLKGDKALYLLLSKGLLDTGRIVEPVYAVEGGAPVYVYESAAISPLYSLLAAPFLWLTGSYFWTQFILTVISWLLFYVAVYAVARIVFRQRWLITLFLLCSAFFLYPHELSSTVKDTFAVGLSLGIVALMHRWLQRPQWKTTILTAVCLLMLAQVKLLYIPLAAVLVFLLFALLLLKRSKKHFIHFLLLVALLFLGGFLTKELLLEPAQAFAQVSGVRLPANTTDVTVGFSPENLLTTFPFVSSSVINTHLWAVQLEKLAGVSFTTVMHSFLYLDILVLIALVAISLYYSRQLLSENLLLFLVIASFTMTAVVMMLSLTGRIVLYKSGGNPWTYVMDARSFLLPMVVLQLLLFRFVFSMGSLPFMRMALAFLFFLTVAHGLYFTAKEIRLAATGTKTKMENDTLDKITALLTPPGAKQPLLVTSDNFLRRYVQVKNLPAYGFTSLPPQLSWMKKGDRFLIATYPEDSLFLKKFPANSLQAIDSILPFHLYSYEVR